MTRMLRDLIGLEANGSQIAERHSVRKSTFVITAEPLMQAMQRPFGSVLLWPDLVLMRNLMQSLN